MARAGGCHCGAIRFEVGGEPAHVALCHCGDCRRSAGAPMVAWAAFRDDALNLLQGEPAAFSSDGTGRRNFCGTCGTGLFYRNEAVLPGLVDIQVGVFDDAEALAPGAHIQAAERLGWMKTQHELPAFERYPG